MRLGKHLAHAGIASRRASEEIVRAGRVTVGGETVTDPARAVGSDDDVRVDGSPVTATGSAPGRAVYAVHKPAGVVSTARDTHGRPTVVSLVTSERRLYPVGRLDADTTGLILLTDDGDLAHRLTHPSFEVPKTYLATVTGSVPRGLGKTLRAGVELDDGPARVDDFAVVDAVPGRTLVRVTLHEGRKRIVRRLLAEVGFPVEALVRTDIGGVTLGEQRPGSIRVLTRKEVGELYKAVGL